MVDMIGLFFKYHFLRDYHKLPQIESRTPTNRTPQSSTNIQVLGIERKTRRAQWVWQESIGFLLNLMLVSEIYILCVTRSVIVELKLLWYVLLITYAIGFIETAYEFVLHLWITVFICVLTLYWVAKYLCGINESFRIHCILNQLQNKYL